MRITSQALPRLYLMLAALMLPLSASSQVTLTGATWFATNSRGGTNVNQGYGYGFVNTIGGDQWWNLWIALNPDATLPVNGPSDAQANILVPLQAGKQYKYYFFSECCSLPDSGLSLYFNGSVATPGISVFGPLGKFSFALDNSEILSLQGNPISSVGSSFFNSAGVIVVLAEFNANGPASPPGDVCQPFTFTPDPSGALSGFGSFTLDVYSAATFSSSQTSDSPLSEVTLTGGGFAPGENVNITADRLGLVPLGAAKADGSGSLSATVRLNQHAYGALELFAMGQTSHTLGALSMAVIPSVTSVPDPVAPGGTTAIEGLGFGYGELVDVYLDEPRQLLGTVAANALGSFVGTNAVTVTIPANAPQGLNGIIGIGQTTSAVGIGKIILN